MSRGIRSVIRHRAAGGIITPPAISGLGYTQQFFDDFTSASTVTGNTSFTTPQAGVNWYPSLGHAETIPTNYSVLTTTTASAFSNGNSGGGSNASPSGGILSIKGNSLDTITNNFISIPEALYATSSAVGTFGPTGYWEGYMQYNSTGTGHIAFWTYPATPAAIFTEIDLVEANIGGSHPNWYIGNFNQWQGTGSTDVAYTSCNQVTAKDANWHTFGMLIVATSGGQGTATAYLDNVSVGSVTIGTGTPYPTVLADTNGPAKRYWIIGKDNGADTLNFDWIKYWGP